MASNSRALAILLLTSGFLIGGLLFDYMPMIIDSQIKTNVELATNEEIKALWSKPPVDLHSYYWLYDVLNVDQFMAGEKIQVRKVGPYHFTLLEGTRHAAGSFGDDPRLKSQVFISVSKLMERFNETLFINSTARVALMGRRVAFFEKAKKMADTFGMAARFPDDFNAERPFGFVSLLNGTQQGPFEIYTGYRDTMSSLGDLISYKGKRRQADFQGRCNWLQVSVGELRPMPLHPDQTLQIYQPQLCRIVRLKPGLMRKMREGQVINYRFAQEDFSNYTENPENACYCKNDSIATTNDNYCSLNGAIELAPCAYYSPMVLTVNNIEPDARIAQSIGNWEPELTKSDVDMVPAVDGNAQMLILRRVGVPIQGDVTITLYMKVVRDPAFKVTGSLPEISYIPLVMVREMGSIPPKLARIIINLESFIALSHHIKVIMYLSAIVLLCYLTTHYYGRSARDRIQPTSGGGGGGADRGSQSNFAAGDNQDRGQTTNLDQRGNNNGVAVGLSGAASAVMGASGVANQVAQSDRQIIRQQRNDGDDQVAQLRRKQQEELQQQLKRKQASVNSTERANSADSNRSLPPSRVSRGSLDVDELASVGGKATANEQLSGEPRPEELARKLNDRARVFSKVDELRQPVAVLSSAAAELESPLEDEAKTTGLATRTNKNWFIKVCSNFVRILSGLRSSINDASQLQVQDNNDDYQDKQLEMLAGKIDNWYSSQTGDFSPSQSPAELGPVGSEKASAKAQAPRKLQASSNNNSEANDSKRNSKEPGRITGASERLIASKGETSDGSGNWKRDMGLIDADNSGEKLLRSLAGGGKEGSGSQRGLERLEQVAGKLDDENNSPSRPGKQIAAQSSGTNNENNGENNNSANNMEAAQAADGSLLDQSGRGGGDGDRDRDGEPNVAKSGHKAGSSSSSERPRDGSATKLMPSLISTAVQTDDEEEESERRSEKLSSSISAAAAASKRDSANGEAQVESAAREEESEPAMGSPTNSVDSVLNVSKTVAPSAAAKTTIQVNGLDAEPGEANNDAGAAAGPGVYNQSMKLNATDHNRDGGNNNGNNNHHQSAKLGQANALKGLHQKQSSGGGGGGTIDEPDSDRTGLAKDERRDSGYIRSIQLAGR